VFVHPLLGREAEQGLDLRADVRVAAQLVGKGAIDDSRDAFS